MRDSILATALLALGLIIGTAPVTAQQRGPGWGMMGGPSWGMPMGRGMGRMTGMGGCPMWEDADVPAFAKGRIAFLKAELAITDAQKPLWDAYADAIQKNLINMRGVHQTMRAAWQATSPVDRLDARITAMEGRLATLKHVEQPLVALYAAFSDEQKKTADELLTGMGCML